MLVRHFWHCIITNCGEVWLFKEEEEEDVAENTQSLFNERNEIQCFFNFVSLQHPGKLHPEKNIFGVFHKKISVRISCFIQRVTCCLFVL